MGECWPRCRTNFRDGLDLCAFGDATVVERKTISTCHLTVHNADSSFSDPSTSNGG